MEPTRRLPILIFLASLASLAFEVLLVRIFSITLWYHFAFMIVSIAMLGFAASGTILAALPGLKRLDRIGWYILFLAVAMPVGYLLANQVSFDPVRLAWERAELLKILLLYLCLALPFFCTGLVIATAFSVESGRAGLLYGADLLGAGAGSVGILLLTALAPPEHGVFVLSLAVLAAAFLAGGSRLRMAALIPALLDLVLLLAHPGFVHPRISPYKGLEAALRHPGAERLRTYHSPFARIDTFRSPAARFAPGLALGYLEPLPDQVGFAVDGGEVGAITAASDPGGLAFLDQLPAALPYAMGARRQVLLLDPKGGLPVLMARRMGAERIMAVEGNPELVRVIRRDFRAFSGDIYGTDTWTGLGRSWLAGRGERFDLIDISLQGAEPSGAFGIAEDYRLTVEAFREYLSHLADDGLLGVSLFILPPPRTELRILATLAAALEELGVREAGLHVAAVRSWGSITMVAKRTPLTPAETEAARRFARERRFDLVWLPGVRPEETNLFVRMPDDGYFRAFAAILSPEGRKSFLDGYLFDVEPVRDEAPFFAHFLKAGKLRETWRTMGEKWQFFLEEGYILPAVLVQALLLSFPLVLLPALAGKGEGGAMGARILPYFAFLGLGYMFVEVALIQKLILPLEHPPYAVAAVLAALLASSGAGSLLGHRVPGLARPATAAVIGLIVALLALILPGATSLVAPWPLPLRGAALCLLVALPGTFMGIPFPAGLKLLGERAPGLIPWAWAINGVFSVLAPLLAVMAAMAVGFGGVLVMGGAAYLLAFLLLKKVMGNR